MNNYIDSSSKPKISRNWYLAAIILAILSNFLAYVLIFDHEAEVMLFSSTVSMLMLAFFLKNFLLFRDDETTIIDTTFPELILGKNGIIQNVNDSFIKKYNDYDFLEIGRNFAAIIPVGSFNTMISPLNIGKPQLVIARTKNGVSIKNFVAITKGLSNVKDCFEILLFEVDANDTSFDAESHQQRLQAIGQLAIGISHDFNNVLTAIRGYSELLQEKISEESDIYEDVTQIKENCNRASELVRQLLTFSRKHEVTFTKIDLYDAITYTSKLLGRLLGEKIVINIIKKTENNLIYADKNQIEQVIINLALNAKDAMPDGGKLDISIDKRKISENNQQLFHKMYKPTGSGAFEPGNYIELKISDSGSGIDANILSKIFEPFFTTKGKLNGTGLGLSTVFSIVKQVGGQLFVDSTGNGVTFLILFKEFIGSNSVKSSSSFVQQSSIVNKNAKTVIMVVEDEEPVRVFSAHALRNKGYTVIEAENAEMAIDIFDSRDGKIDVLLTDVIMPGLNGPELACNLSERNKKLKVVLMSGYTEEEIVSPFFKQEFLFLSKPFSLSKLVETVSLAAGSKERT